MSSSPAFLPPNLFKAALASGKPQVGLWSSLCSNIVAEILAGSGFDWILVDTEHAPNEIPDVLAQLQAMATGTAEPVVRCAWNDTVLIKRVLDIGARSILVPFVQNAQEAAAAVAATRRSASAAFRWLREPTDTAACPIITGRPRRTSASWCRWKRGRP